MLMCQLYCVLFCYCYRSFCYCSTLFDFVHFLFDSFYFHCSLFMRKYSILILDCMYSRYFDPVPVVREVRVHHHLCKSNKYHTSDFVLVQERVAYYDHRHSGIYGTNILQALKQAESETGRRQGCDRGNELMPPVRCEGVGCSKMSNPGCAKCFSTDVC
jgi:hypothetical protein